MPNQKQSAWTDVGYALCIVLGCLSFMYALVRTPETDWKLVHGADTLARIYKDMRRCVF